MTRSSGRSPSHRRWALLAVLTALCASSGPAYAADETSDTLAARQRFRAGAAAFASGHYADAVEQFLAADRLSPSAALSFDIARAYEKLGEPSLALKWYRDYLRRAHDAPDAEQVRRTVRSLENGLREKGVQQVTIRSTPRGATVAIDGERVGVTPWSGDLPPGRHRATFAYEGYARTTQSFVLPPAEAVDVDVELTPENPATPPLQLEPSASAASVPPPAATSPSLEPATSSSSVRTVGIVLASVGAVAFGGALAAELVREDAQRSAKKETTQVGYASKYDTMEASQTAARILVGVGGGLVITGGVPFFVGAPRNAGHSGSDVALGCTGRYCGATVAGKF